MNKLFLILAVFVNFSIHAQITPVTVISGLATPVAFAIAPDGRFFVSLKGFDPGYPSLVQVYSPVGVYQSDLWNFTDSTETEGEKGVLGIALDPAFAVNHYVYVFYNHKAPAKIRVVRFTEVAGIGTNPTVILELGDAFSADYHTGGNIHIRPSDPTHIYISIGDKGVTADAQDITKWNGKILRIGTDGSIPTDNPFYDDGNPATLGDDRIWARGLRNTFDFCFSSVNDSLYSTENGVSSYDELNQIRKGGNYGWPFCEGVTGSCSGYAPPLEVFGAAVPALTGVIFYSSTVMPELTNHVLVADYNGGNIHNVVLGNAPFYDQFISRTTLAGGGFANITDIEQGPDGCVYVSEINAGKISKFCTVVGVNEINTRNEFSVYPNPANDKISVQGKNVKQLTLLDQQGKLLLSQMSNEMCLTGLENGIYLLRVNETFHTKIIVQR